MRNPNGTAQNGLPIEDYPIRHPAEDLETNSDTDISHALGFALRDTGRIPLESFTPALIHLRRQDFQEGDVVRVSISRGRDGDISQLETQDV